MVDAADSKSAGAILVGSSPTARTSRARRSVQMFPGDRWKWSTRLTVVAFAAPWMPAFAGPLQNPRRHAGLVPASTFPHTGKHLLSRNSGPRNKALLSEAEGSGVTEGSGRSTDFSKVSRAPWAMFPHEQRLVRSRKRGCRNRSGMTEAGRAASAPVSPGRVPGSVPPARSAWPRPWPSPLRRWSCGCCGAAGWCAGRCPPRQRR